MKTAKYQKRCYDQIEGVIAENKALIAEVDRLRSEAERERRRERLKKSVF
jgi:hypothetical protein